MLTQANSKLADIIAEQEAIFVKRQPKSAALADRAKGVLAGGVTSSWQITQPQPVWLSHGSGGKVYDADGNEYVDLHGGYGASLAGHAHPAIVRAVKAQVARGTHFAQPTENAIAVGDLVRLLLALPTSNALVRQIVEPDDGTPNGWDHRDFARAIGAAMGKKVLPLSLPRPVLSTIAALDGVFRGKNAKLTRDRVAYFCHPDWVASAERRPPARLWQPQVKTPTGLKETADWYRAEGWLR